MRVNLNQVELIFFEFLNVAHTHKVKHWTNPETQGMRIECGKTFKMKWAHRNWAFLPMGCLFKGVANFGRQLSRITLKELFPVENGFHPRPEGGCSLKVDLSKVSKVFFKHKIHEKMKEK